MPSLQITAQAVLPTDSLMSHVTIWRCCAPAAREVLVATTRADGALTAWDIGAALPAGSTARPWARPMRPGRRPR